MHWVAVMLLADYICMHMYTVSYDMRSISTLLLDTLPPGLRCATSYWLLFHCTSINSVGCLLVLLVVFSGFVFVCKCAASSWLGTADGNWPMATVWHIYMKCSWICTVPIINRQINNRVQSKNRAATIILYPYLVFQWFLRVSALLSRFCLT